MLELVWRWCRFFLPGIQVNLDWGDLKRLDQRKVLECQDGNPVDWDLEDLDCSRVNIRGVAFATIALLEHMGKSAPNVEGLRRDWMRLRSELVPRSS